MGLFCKGGLIKNMALIPLDPKGSPAYIALSSDIVANTVSGIGLIGKTLWTSDDNRTYLILGDLTLAPFSLPGGHTSVSVSPTNQVSVDAWTDFSGSTLDTINNTSVSYTVVNVLNNTICWKVLGANISTFTDAQTVQASADLALNAIGSYSASVAVWRYYKVQIQSKVSSTPGTVQLRGIAK